MADVRKLNESATSAYNASNEFSGMDEQYSGSPSAVPPKANAAPKVSKNVAIGLVSALNNQEAEMVKSGIFKIANIYSIEFAPAILGDSRVAKGGTPSKSKTPMQRSKNPSDKVNPKSNSVAYDVRTFEIAAGTPIVAVLDQILKNSSYITDQANVIIEEGTQETKPQKPLGDLAWYKISVQTTPIGFDSGRNDFAYKIKYIISAYGINDMNSEFYPEARLRGRHKSYKYWFTGQNTQVTRFEQSFNKLYSVTFTNPATLGLYRAKTNHRESPAYVYQAAVAASSSQGAEGKTNSIGASAADYLYSPSDIAKTRIEIIGDPAWLQQGEAAVGLDSLNFNFNPFEPDGTINFEAQEIIFDLQWNPGVDYDVNGTGLANPNVGQDPQAIYTYKASTITSTFSKGKFSQELNGVLIELPVPEIKAAVTGSPTNESSAETARLANAGNRPAAQTPTQIRDAKVLKINQDATEAYNNSNEFAGMAEQTGPSVGNSGTSIRPFTPGEPDVNTAVNADDPEAQVFLQTASAPPSRLTPEAVAAETNNLAARYPPPAGTPQATTPATPAPAGGPFNNNTGTLLPNGQRMRTLSDARRDAAARQAAAQLVAKDD